MSQSSIPRRTFIKSVLIAGAAPLILPGRLWSAPFAPSDRIGIGFIGIGKQAQGHVSAFLKTAGTQVLAVCDVDRNRREYGKKMVDDYYSRVTAAENTDCTAHEDFRELLLRKDLDAVVISTPDHWHAPMALAALAAGKDVYCEKPLTQTVQEAVRVMEATERSGRMFQTGSQQRSSREFGMACELVRNGVIGDVSRVEAGFGGPGRWCDLPEEAAEPGLNWNLWLGPAPYRAYNSVLSPRGVHKHFPNWRDYWEYGGGRVTDWGAHHVDIAHWALDMDASGPVEMLPPAQWENAKAGGRLRFANGTELTHVEENGVTFFGNRGTLFVNRSKFKLTLDGKEVASFMGLPGEKPLLAQLDEVETAYLKDAKVVLYDHTKTDHRADWLASIRTRKQPIANVQVGGRTVISCHLLNMGYRYGQAVKWDPIRFTFAGATGNLKWLTREYNDAWKVT